MRPQFQRPHQLLVAALVALVVLPILGSYLRSGGLPPDITIFPLARETVKKPAFSLFYVVAAVIAALVIVAFLIFPRLFGFRSAPAPSPASAPAPSPASSKKRCNLPVWFFVGVVVNLASWWAMWFGPAVVANFSFVPLWWGFIIATDGLVYARNGGRSLLSAAPQRLLVLTIVSVPAWFLFEYLNYFALAFWIYPCDQIFSPAAQAAWYLLSFSTVWPAVFEWYTLLRTSEGLSRRWADGPRLSVSSRWNGAIALVALLSLVLFAMYPFELFILLWIGPPLVLIAALGALGFWTPLRPIERGNWTPLVLVALASLCNGFFWELWNYGSRAFNDYTHTNPNFWEYRIPYVDIIPKVFSEMPFFGYFGYLPFGGLVWVCWLVAAHILGLDPDFRFRDPSDRDTPPP